MVQDHGVFPGLRGAKSPEPRAYAGDRPGSSVFHFPIKGIGSGFQAQSFGLPRNDGGGTC